MIHQAGYFARWVLNNPWTVGILSWCLVFVPILGMCWIDDISMVGNTGNRSVKNTNEFRRKREFYKSLRERIKQLRMEHLFEEPCPLYEPDCMG